MDEEDGAINVSPLIDVVFILLIFFIVSATFVTLPGIDVSRPKVQNATSLKKILFCLHFQIKVKSFMLGKRLNYLKYRL